MEPRVYNIDCFLNTERRLELILNPIYNELKINHDVFFKNVSLVTGKPDVRSFFKIYSETSSKD